jgi:hypothetical protein
MVLSIAQTTNCLGVNRWKGDRAAEKGGGGIQWLKSCGRLMDPRVATRDDDDQRKEPFNQVSAIVMEWLTTFAKV